jgi:5-methylthioadenosine/S-adenosylhomocysteine deaminase
VDQTRRQIALNVVKSMAIRTGVMMAQAPLDPAAGPAFALSGRIVTMDRHRTVLPTGVVYGQNGSIVAVQPAGADPPAGFGTVRVVDTKGTIYPGLIELHNHLPYDVLALWQVPKLYGNRGQWSDSEQNPDYHRLITGPMHAIGSDPSLVAAIVRYVELRCLLAGTTTSQGVTLANSKVSVTHFRGLVRNVENTGNDPALPAAATHVPDVVARDGAKFLQEISAGKKMILHLAEGDDPAALKAFEALDLKDGSWAITKNLIGIHCVALRESDFGIFGSHGGSMVWSPLSNLLLYGKTANVGAAIAHDVPVALGSDWAPSGSKNLLGELKVARLARAAANAPDLSDGDLVAMATCTPAAMLGWDRALGSLEGPRTDASGKQLPGKRADLLVVTSRDGDPYSHLIDATEADLELVMIDGVPRVGTSTLMTSLGVTTGLESIRVGGQDRMLNLGEAAADPQVEDVTAGEAIRRLTKALQDLPDKHTTPDAVAARSALPDGQVRLAVEGLVDNHQSPRPHLPLNGEFTGPNLPDSRTLAAVQEAIAVAGPLPAMVLDPLTAVDNPGFYDTIDKEMNLPPDVRSGLVAHRHAKPRASLSRS